MGTAAQGSRLPLVIIRLCSAPSRFSLGSVRLLRRRDTERLQARRTRSRLLLLLGLRFALCFHFLLYRAVSGSLLSLLSQANDLGLGKFWVFCCFWCRLIKFFFLLFFLTVLTEEINAPKLPGPEGASGTGALWEGARAAGAGSARTRGRGGGREGT